MMISRLESLPDELLDDIFTRLNGAEQYNTALVSWHCYHRVVPHLYRAIELVDCCNNAKGDAHDDSPMISILFTLTENPYLASKVRKLTHRCHFSLPDIYEDLLVASFQNPTFSNDGRTLRLLSRAIHNLVNVNTLRIIHGHHNVTVALLQGFFSKARKYQLPVARLWLESCCLEGVAQRIGVNALLGGLQSVRIRRLRAMSENSTIGELTFSHDERRGTSSNMLDDWDISPSQRDTWIVKIPKEDFQMAAYFDEDIYRRFSRVEGLAEPDDDIDCKPGDSTCQDTPYFVDEEPGWLVSQFVTKSSSTLTSLNLDWVLQVMPLIRNNWISHATFPNLRAFQVRNAVTTQTGFDPDTTISLLQGDWLQFLERHPQIQCLTWPLEHFFHPTSLPFLTSGAENVVMTLGRTLKELRIDTQLLYSPEPNTDPIDSGRAESRRDLEGVSRRLRRRFFIEHIAPHLSTLEVLKIEESIPFDERSEMVRAVRFSPLRKLVIIGASFPPLDTFTRLPSPIHHAPFVGLPSIHETYGDHQPDLLEETDWDTLRVEALSLSSPFAPTYNPSKYSLLVTIALHHASTITTLKFCGFLGAPKLHKTASHRLTGLIPLRHLHNLRHLIMSFSMRTYFEGLDRSDQIRSYWLDGQSPNSTALAIPTGAENQNPWAKLLTEYYAPAKLVEKVTDVLTPRLSTQALARKGGLSVDAVLRLGDFEIFHLDIQLGVHGEVLSYRGPTSENDAEKSGEKLESRSWF